VIAVRASLDKNRNYVIFIVLGPRTLVVPPFSQGWTEYAPLSVQSCFCEI